MDHFHTTSQEVYVFQECIPGTDTFGPLPLKPVYWLTN